MTDLTDQKAASNRLGLRPDEFAKATGLGRSTVFELIRRGEIRAVVFGRRAIVIPIAEVERLLGKLPGRGAA